MANRLDEILNRKRQHVADRKALMPQSQLDARAVHADPPRKFSDALAACRLAGRYGLIAEMKRASPSQGMIRADFDAPSIARAYQAGGAACLSVLTDTPYFQGVDTDLAAARGACRLPVLRKDFIIDEYQIAESRALEADCILLIVAALDDAQLHSFSRSAAGCGMDVLVEVHDRRELDRALAIEPRLLGINNRNLKTMQINLATSRELAEHVPAGVLLISESGLSVPADLASMAVSGITTFLIGESLLRQEDLESATRSLLVDRGVEL